MLRFELPTLAPTPNDTKHEHLVERIGERLNALRAEIHTTMIGQENVVSDLLCALLAGGHCLIVGVPGLAKTLLVKTLARCLARDFRRVQFTPDLMPSDVLGAELLETDPVTGARAMRFVEGPVFTNVLLADEINRTPPKTQSALLEVMQEHSVTVGGKTMPVPRPFFVVATQNPIEQEGTYPLPEAQLDRFMFCLHVDYPTAEDEEQIALLSPDAETTTDAVMSATDLEETQTLVRQMPASPHVARYAVSLTRALRPDDSSATPLARKYAQWGPGPRASQWLIRAAKAQAALHGKPSPSCADVRRVAVPALRHRVIPNYTALADGVNTVEIVRELLETVREPAYGHL